MEQSLHIHYNQEQQWLDIRDTSAALHELPDDLFTAYPEFKSLQIRAANLIRLPSSFDSLQLQSLTISGTKLKQLPDSLFSMPIRQLIVSDNNGIDFDKEADRLGQSPPLSSMGVGG